MPSLFDIGLTYDTINRLLHESMDEHGEVPPEVLATIDEWFAESDAMTQDKADAYAYTIARMEADAMLCRKEAARLSKRAGTFDNTAERIRLRIREFLDKHHNGSLRTTKHNFWSQMNAPSVEIEDPTKLPSSLVKEVVTTIKPDKAALIDLWKNDQPLPQGVTVTQGRHLRIK